MGSRVAGFIAPDRTQPGLTLADFNSARARFRTAIVSATVRNLPAFTSAMPTAARTGQVLKCRYISHWMGSLHQAHLADLYLLGILSIAPWFLLWLASLRRIVLNRA